VGATARLRERQARGYAGHSLVLSLTAAHASTHSVCNLIRHCATDARWETCTFSYDLSPVKSLLLPTWSSLYQNLKSVWDTARLKYIAGDYLYLLDYMLLLLLASTLAFHIFSQVLDSA